MIGSMLSFCFVSRVSRFLSAVIQTSSGAGVPSGFSRPCRWRDFGALEAPATGLRESWMCVAIFVVGSRA